MQIKKGQDQLTRVILQSTNGWFLEAILFINIPGEGKRKG